MKRGGGILEREENKKPMEKKFSHEAKKETVKRGDRTHRRLCMSLLSFGQEKENKEY